jgi:hypothetical protein
LRLCPVSNTTIRRRGAFVGICLHPDSAREGKHARFAANPRF